MRNAYSNSNFEWEMRVGFLKHVISFYFILGVIPASAEQETCYKVHLVPKQKLGCTDYETCKPEVVSEFSDGSILVAKEGDLCRSEDLSSFQCIHNASIYDPKFIRMSEDGKILVGVHNGLLVSSGWGKPFEKLDDKQGIGKVPDSNGFPVSNPTVYDIKFGPRGEWVLGTGAGISISQDNGKTFTNYTLFKPGGTVTWGVESIEVTSSGKIFSNYRDKIIASSIFAPDSWTFIEVKKELVTLDNFLMIGDTALFAASGRPDTYWRNFRGIKAYDIVKGTAWITDSFGYPRHLRSDGNGVVLATFSKQGVGTLAGFSNDGGKTFETFNSTNLSSQLGGNVEVFLPGRSASSRIFALTNGVYRNPSSFAIIDLYKASHCP